VEDGAEYLWKAEDEPEAENPPLKWYSKP
jgi:hypothetical protein